MKKTFEVKGVDLTSLYGVGDKNILFLETQLPLNLISEAIIFFAKD